MSTDANTREATTPNTGQEHKVNRHTSRRCCARTAVMFVASVLVVLSLCVGSALGDYGQVADHFGVSGEAEQLLFSSAMAVNVSGVGGVEPGSLYVVGRNARVVRFGPGKEGEEPPFREAWGWGVANGAAEFQRCGPAVAAYPTCRPVDSIAPNGGEETGHFEYPAGVAVDQATGDVYVLNTSELRLGILRGHHLIEVFSATGQPVENGAGEDGFGDAGRDQPQPSESIAEGPEKLHRMGTEQDGIAVDEAGTVYVTDLDYQEIANPPGETRVMCFRPEHPGEYEHYVYCGQASDITASGSQPFQRIALVGGGRLVAAAVERIREYALGGGSTPLCSFTVPGGQLLSMTANPQTGEVFYFNRKELHRLGACNAGTGHFETVQAAAIKAEPEEKDTIDALAFDPALAWGPLRPAGTLYGADSKESGTLVEGTFRFTHEGIGDIFAPAKVFSPSVRTESVLDTGTDASTLQAEIDPHGFTTAYRFQYLGEAVYAAQRAQAEGEGKSGAQAEAAAFAGAAEAPLDGGQISGAGVGVAAATVSGLQPDSEYRFRVIATSECEGAVPPQALCETVGQAASFRTYPTVAPGLPDGRAYELVSPPQKHGGEVFPADPRFGSCRECKPPGKAITGGRFPMQSAPDGEAIVYQGQPFSSTEGAAFLNEYLSKRTGSGWQTTALSPALQSKQPPQGALAFDSTLSQGLIYQVTPSLSPQAPSEYPDLYAQQTAEPGSLTPLITTATSLHKSATAFELRYAGHSADFSCQLFAANDALTATVPPFAPAALVPGAGERDLYESVAGQLSLVSVLPGDATAATGAAFASASPDSHAVSADCSRVFWADGAGRLYVREDGQRTLELPGASPSATFLAANASGSEVLLSDGQIDALDETGDAYEAAVDLTEAGSVHRGGFQGILGFGEQHGNISRLYFVDTAVLSGEEENEYGAKAQTGKDNLYSWKEGSTSFIATLSSLDDGSEAGVDWSADPAERTAEASPDGGWLAFSSVAPLTGYENFGPTCGFNSVGELVATNCREVFLYNAATGKLSCASCNLTGETPLGPSTLRRIYAAKEWFPQPRYLTDSGRLFFDSQDRLSPLDTNGRIEDVYEYEPRPLGGCERAAGCVSLISPGSGTVDSNFLAMDETGRNVFFTTRERLVPSDTDELIDLYDAREGGGFTTETETQRAECQGEACQSFVAPPVAMTFASFAFQGAGNSQPAVASPKPQSRSKKCAKGKVRKRGVCVKQHKYAKQKARRANRNRGGSR